MSRALDKKLVDLLDKSDHEQAYLAISEVLIQNPASQAESVSYEYLDLEILPPSHLVGVKTYVLQDGLSFGISKIGLIQAFFWARKLLMDHVKGSALLAYDSVMKTSAVVLLMDPEHLTAANTRKRSIIARLREDATGPSQESRKARLAHILLPEHCFVGSLLTSRLHRHTKSPTLWNHRRWLMQTMREHEIEPKLRDEIQNVILVAAERHPRNYYAWQYARWLHEEYDTVCWPPLFRDWSHEHHDDISGWAFLLSWGSRPGILVDKAFELTLHSALAFRWTNESVWVFLRGLTQLGLSEANMAKYHAARKSLGVTCAPETPGTSQAIATDSG